MEDPVQKDFRVIRGPDWAYKNQDGGKGHVGTVVRLDDGLRPTLAPKSVLVQWDNGDKGLYRVGYDQAFDLRIIDTAKSVRHPKIWCDGCDVEEIRGIRWRCTECYNFDLCTSCYMNDKHDLTHVFMRLLSSHKTSLGPRMPPRCECSKITIRGNFRGAKVAKHPQWFQRYDSGNLLGTVLNQTPETRAENCAMVEFTPTPEKVSLTRIICTQPGNGGQAYDGQLPNLGDPDLVKEGDNVLVTATPRELKILHIRRGLWNPNLEKTFRKRGFVNSRTNTGDLEVTIIDSQETFTMNSLALRRLHRMCLGLQVRVGDDLEMVKRMQAGHGGWSAKMKQTLGKVGKIVEIDGLDIHVQMGDLKFIFNSVNLTPARIIVPTPGEVPIQQRINDAMQRIQEPESDLIIALGAGDIHAVERILLVHPDWVNHEVRPGRTPLSIACRVHIDMVKLLVSKGAFIESYDEEGCTPLHRATECNKYDIVRYLLEQGADVDAVANKGLTSLALACDKGYFECAHFLLENGADINQTMVEGVSPALLTIKSGSRTTVDLAINRLDSDLKRVPMSYFSAMHCAANVGETYALTKLIDRIPRLVEARDIVGSTPLLSAVHGGSLQAAKLLISKGKCRINAVDDKGVHALSTAIALNDLHFVDILIKNGADPNLPNQYGNTALQVAINIIDKNGHGGLVRLITEEPYMTEMKKKWGHLGIKTNEDALLAYLVSHGADLNAQTRYKNTIRSGLELTKNTLVHSLVEIQNQIGKDIAKQKGAVSHPLRKLTKKKSGTEPHANTTSLLKDLTTDPGSKGKSFLSSSRTGPRNSGSQQTNTWAGFGVDVQKEQEESVAVSRKGDEQHLLQAELKRKDDELKTLRARVMTLEHLVKKKITFSCGHDVIKSISDLIPECPNCGDPITSVVDL